MRQHGLFPVFNLLPHVFGMEVVEVDFIKRGMDQFLFVLAEGFFESFLFGRKAEVLVGLAPGELLFDLSLELLDVLVDFFPLLEIFASAAGEIERLK